MCRVEPRWSRQVFVSFGVSGNNKIQVIELSTVGYTTILPLNTEGFDFGALKHELAAIL